MKAVGTRCGFTLVEIIVVIALIGIVSGVALPAFGVFLDDPPADATAGHLRAAQRRAVETGEPVRVVVDAGPVLFLPDGRSVGSGVAALSGRVTGDGP